MKKYIITNFAYGTGPFLRTTQLGLAFNDELQSSGEERLGIIVPLVYGEKQKKIMREEFGSEDAKHPGEILLDPVLGGIAGDVLFSGLGTYEAYLRRWAGIVKKASKLAHERLYSSRLSLVTLKGEKKEINGRDICVEFSRSPRLRYDVAPVFFTSFAYLGEILEKTLELGRGEIFIDKSVLEQALPLARLVEEGAVAHSIPYPGTFSHLSHYLPRYSSEILTPPLGPLFRPVRASVKRGVYVTATGIPGLGRLYADARKLGIKLYSNNPAMVPGSSSELPHIIADKNILFHFARAGWSSIWFSLLADVPLVTPPYDVRDDPEIYFNNKAVEALGIGVIWRGEALADLLKKAEVTKRSRRLVREAVKRRFGMWDGIRFSAKLFAEKYLGLPHSS